MQLNLINNRYRVIKNLSQDRIMSSYLVSDMINNHEKIQLNIINSEFATEVLINYYNSEFITFISINHPNMSKVFDFGFIRNIDNKKIENGDYFYTDDFLEGSKELAQIIKDIDQNKILDIFMQLCLVLNYLHKRGFVYGELNTENIVISYNDDKYKLLLKDLPTVAIQKQDYGHSKLIEQIFKAPEQSTDDKPTIASDIYSMGVVLVQLCNIEVEKNSTLQQSIFEFEDFIKLHYRDSLLILKFYNNLIKIMKKMIDDDLNYRYNNINEIVKDVNEFFNTEYKAYLVEEIKKLDFNTKIVGRNEEITKIINLYDKLVNHNESKGIIFVQGEQGIGKTRFLKEIKHLLYMKKANVYSSFAMQNGTDNNTNNKAIIEILKKIVSSCDEEIIKRYQSELVKLIPELGKETNIVASESLMGKKEKYRLISRIYSFIQESISSKPTVFIIDNATCLDDFSIELLEYIDVQNYNEQNILIILSYNKVEYMSSSFVKLLNKNLKNIKITLNNFTEEETATIIQSILRMPALPSEFGKKVYAKTYGNPLFVEETLKDFIAKKILGINENNGKWNTPFETLEEMPIASTMEQALLNQIKEINKGSYEVLSNISIFNNPVSIEVIEKLFIGSDFSVEDYVNELCDKGILCRRIEDMGLVFDFNNKVLKNLIYNKLNEKQRKMKHEVAADLLESLLETEGGGSKAELIYHLEKANDKYRTVKYCIELAEEMIALRIMDEAISKYKKALLILSDEEDINKKVEILLKIGDIYVDMGNLSEALETYKKPYEYSMDLIKETLRVDVVNKIAYMYVKRNELEMADEYIKKGESILENINYMEGYLENRKLTANQCMSKQKYEKVLEVCTEGIDKCGDKHLKQKGLFYNILGVMYSETSSKVKALECYRKGLEYFEKINYPVGMCHCLNNIGVIYGDHYQKREIAITYYKKILVICEENNLKEVEQMALLNLAVCNIEDFNYDAGLKYLKDVLVKSRDMGLEANIFYTYNYISYISLKMGNNKEAYEYYLLAKEELRQHPIQGKDISLFYQMCAELNYAMGDINQAILLVKMGIEICNDDNTTRDYTLKSLLFILELEKSQNLDAINQYIQNMNVVMDRNKNNIDKVNLLYEVCIALCEKGYTDKAKELYEADTSSKKDIYADVIKLKGLYLKGFIYKDETIISNLMGALELCKKLKNKVFQWKVCNAIGDYYSSQKDYFYAVNYYFEACEIIKDCTMQFPQELRVNYINFWSMIKPFNAIKGISKTFTNSKVQEINFDEDIILNNEELTNLFNYNAFSEILHNKKFVESSKKIYRSILPPGIKNINDIIANMCDEPLQVLDSIIKLISSMVLSTRSLIISEGNDGQQKIVASSNENHDIEDIRLILKRVNETKKSLIVSETFDSVKNVSGIVIPKGMKSIMCIPILRKHNCITEVLKNENKRDNDEFRVDNIKGYLYMESERMLNNFNEESLNECSELTSFVSFIVENYLLKISSSIDKLTGTLTRRFLEEALSQQIENSNDSRNMFSILMFDLDNFKGVNDRFGHQTGDQVLRDVCKVVLDLIRKNDLCGRYGGEEFIVILPETDTALAYEISERIRRSIDEKKLLGTKRELTVSIGIATYPDHGKWKHELVEKADQALYMAKSNGRNRSQVWDEKFTGTVKSTNKLLGIVSGNLVQDSRNILAMVEIMDIVKAEYDIETKIFKALGRIIETTEAQNGMFFMVHDNKTTEKFARRIFKEEWAEVKDYSEDIIEAVIKDKQSKCIIDWDAVVDYDVVTGMPNWNSVLVIPIIKAGCICGILYLTIPIKVKEFKLEDLNLISMIGQLLVGML